MSAPEPALEVVTPGLLSTIQDLGRPGHRLAGVPPGGAMDRFALSAANLLVGNPPGAAALECAFSGPVLVARRAGLVAITGADFRARLNGVEVAGWTSTFVAPGDRLDLSERRAGARIYLALAGGLAADRWLSSAATYLLVGRGGLGGRPLRAGDVLAAAAPSPRPLVAGRTLPENWRPEYRRDPELGVIAGPHLGRLGAPGKRLLFSERWRLSGDADRMGYRLEGARLQIAGPEMISFGLTYGCVQVPPSGQPILLMADHQTAGGYPVVAAAGRAALPLAAQLLPGDHLSFREITVEAAQADWRRLQAGLDQLAR